MNLDGLRVMGLACDCTEGACGRAPDDAVQGREWSVCPIGVTRDPIWKSAVWLSQLLDVGLLSGVAENWSAGISMAIVALRHAQVERRAQIEAERVASLPR